MSRSKWADRPRAVPHRQSTAISGRIRGRWEPIGIFFLEENLAIGSTRAQNLQAKMTINDPDDLPPCAGCGICCHLVVELAPGIDHVPEEFVVEHDGVRCMDQRGNGACVALDPATRLCTIYDHRPKTCRDFQRGEPLCRSVVAKALAARGGPISKPSRCSAGPGAGCANG
jgi:hypothetical protein